MSEQQRDVHVIRRAAAQLRHAYAQLLRSSVIDQASFAEGLLSPEIKRLERLAERMEAKSRDTKPCGMCGGTGIAKPITPEELAEANRAIDNINRMLTDAQKAGE